MSGLIRPDPGRSFSLRVPASTSNLGAGFDTLSAALSLHLKVDVEVVERDGVEWVRGWELPPEENVLDATLRRTVNHLGSELPGLRISMDNPIPLRRGLGSSGAAIIAGVRIAERLSGRRLETQELLDFAFPMEGHPDNISASLLGGWVVSWVEGSRIRAAPLPSGLNCRFVVTIPEVTISTREARNILPEKYEREDAVFNLQRCGLMVHALHSGRTDLLGEAMQDRLHQPFRARLIPGASRLLERHRLPTSLEDSLFGLSISGSGSALIALAGDAFDDIGRWMVETLKAAGVSAFYRVLDLDREGARVLPANR